MVPLDIADDSSKYKLLFDQFIDGIDPNTSFSQEEQHSLDEMTKKLKSYYQWNETKPFVYFASPNCSDMIIHVGAF
jgi:hypothetical protein